MIRILLPAFLLGLGAAATAQEADKPLGELLEALPAPEGERRPATAPPPPPVPPGGVGTLDLPASRAAEGPLGELEAAEAAPEAAPLDAEARAAAEADAAWAAMQEERRAKVNAVEAPLVDRLNTQVIEREEARRRAAAEAQAAYEQSLAEREAEMRRREVQYAAAVERHRREVERQRAQYQACLAGDEIACPPR